MDLFDLLSGTKSIDSLTDLDLLADSLLCSGADKNMDELLGNFLDKLNILEPNNSLDIINNILCPTNKEIPTTTPTNKEIPTTTPTNKEIPTTTPTNKEIPTTTPTNKEINGSTIGVIGNDGLIKYIAIRIKQIIIDEKSIAKEFLNIIQERIKEIINFIPTISENTAYKTIQSYRRPKKRSHIYTNQISVPKTQTPIEKPKLLLIRKKDILPLTQKIKTTHRSYGKYGNKLSIDRWRGIGYETANDELEDLYYSEEDDTDSVNLYQKDIITMYQRKSQTYAARRRY